MPLAMLLFIHIVKFYYKFHMDVLFVISIFNFLFANNLLIFKSIPSINASNESLNMMGALPTRCFNTLSTTPDFLTPGNETPGL